MITPYAGNTPNRLSSPETFSADTDYYHNWLTGGGSGGAIAEHNADIAALNTNDTRDTSASSVLIGTGTKVFTVSAGKSFSAGQWLTISNTPAPANQMIAYVVSYSGTTLTVTVPANGVFGSGTLAAWTIALTAAPSAQVSAAMVPVAAAADLAAGRAAFGALSNQYLLVQDQKSSGTNGGTSSAGLNDRTLNTVVHNTITGASVAGNQITLPAGTYRLKDGFAMVSGPNGAQASLYNITDSAVAVLGGSIFVDTALSLSLPTHLTGRFTIAATKVFKLRTWHAVGVSGSGLGFPASSGSSEIYSSLTIIKE